ncbi:hypothetical protein [Amycolatopsis thermoflava]|uniref:hypothetical protein n=1 Tax=Amycolatopsis thermoflava TaxID=84480 RepID=UPI0004145F0C|nr:hypothetical protein [Amycolatopsis thermoflava]
MEHEKRIPPPRPGRHSWTPRTGWANTPAGQIEHANPGAEAPAGLGVRPHEGKHRKDERAAVARMGAAA